MKLPTCTMRLVYDLSLVNKHKITIFTNHQLIGVDFIWKKNRKNWHGLLKHLLLVMCYAVAAAASTESSLSSYVPAFPNTRYILDLFGQLSYIIWSGIVLYFIHCLLLQTKWSVAHMFGSFFFFKRLLFFYLHINILFMTNENLVEDGSALTRFKKKAK